jgi:hypothetical protein
MFRALVDHYMLSVCCAAQHCLALFGLQLFRQFFVLQPQALKITAASGPAGIDATALPGLTVGAPSVLRLVQFFDS